MPLYAERRESGRGGSPMSVKPQKITPEWQTERCLSSRLCRLPALRESIMLVMR